MAGRRDIDVSLRVAPLAAAAILLHALAFLTWRLGTRGPRQLLDDLARGTRSVRTFIRGLARGLSGLAMLVVGAGIFAYISETRSDFAILEAIAIVAGLATTMLLGRSVGV